jgi:WD40 repeat protein
VAFAPDGKRIVTGGEDRTIKLWDAESGKEIGMLTADMQRVTTVVFSPDGKTIASGATGGVVRLWDADKCDVRRALVSHRGAITSVAFSPDGQVVASASVDRRVGLWDAKTGRSLGMLSGHKFAVSALAFSPDGRKLASTAGGQAETSARGGELILWDLAGKHPERPAFLGEGTLLCVGFSPDGRQVAYAGDDRLVSVYDIETDRAQSFLLDETESRATSSGARSAAPF